MFATDRDMQVLAVVVAVTCAIPGVFLLLRRMALITDAISHVILLGIVLAYWVVRDLKSPVLVLGAAAAGVVTVALVELLYGTKLVRQDAAIGLVYPAMFSVAVLIVSRFLRNTHLDVDAVLVGDLGQAAAEQVRLLGRFVMPRSTAVMLLLLGVNVGLVVLLWKELKLSTFDPLLAETLGFRPRWLHYGLMVMVSLTVVAAFDAVGPVLVIPLIVVPAATAWLLSDRLGWVVVWSVVLALTGAEGGFWLAQWTDANFAGAMATLLGVQFGLAWLLAPGRGVWSRWRQRRRNERRFLEALLAIHLWHHEGQEGQSEESAIGELDRHLHWTAGQTERVIRRAEAEGLVVRRGGQLELTEGGRRLAEQMLGGGARRAAESEEDEAGRPSEDGPGQRDAESTNQRGAEGPGRRDAEGRG